jgi:transcriptional regulator GlxA family with amidase domain
MLVAMSSEARRVALVAYPAVQPLYVVGPAEVLASADRVVGGRGYALTIAAPDGRSARSDAGVRLEAHRALGEIDPNVEEDFADQAVWEAGALDGNTHVMPWRIEDELKALGANHIQAGLSKGFASKYGNLITGQQNFSLSEIAPLLIEAARR